MSQAAVSSARPRCHRAVLINPRKRAVPAQAFFGLFSPRKAAEEDPETSNAAVERLLTSIEGSERGLCTANGEAVLAAAMELAQLGTH